MVRERFSTDFKTYIRGFNFEKYYMGDANVRNDFKIPEGKKCVDGVGHTTNCPYHLLEEKSSSNIDQSIIQFEVTEEIFREQGLVVNKCILFYNSFGKYKKLFKNQKNFLYSKMTNSVIKINGRLPLELRQIQKRKKK